MTITPQQLYQEGIAKYEAIKGTLPLDYPEIAGKADLATEACLRKMTEGSDSVNKSELYPIVFREIFSDLLKRK